MRPTKYNREELLKNAKMIKFVCKFCGSKIETDSKNLDCKACGALMAVTILPYLENYKHNKNSKKMKNEKSLFEESVVSSENYFMDIIFPILSILRFALSFFLFLLITIYWATILNE